MGNGDRRVRLVTALILALSLAAAACGDDDDEAATDTTAAPDTTVATDTTVGGDTGGESDEFAEVCALAQEIFASENLPTAEQLQRYQEIAPDEIGDAVEIGATALIPAGDDLVAFLAAAAEDDVEEAVIEINAFEEANCGIPHSEEGASPPPNDAIADGTEVVDVVATDYSFSFEGPVAAGPTTFRLSNTGEEAHFLLVAKLTEGVTLDEALASEGETGIEGTWETALAAPGGDDIETVTMELEPGNYGFVCFLPNAEFTPHVALGMAVPVTVS